MHSMNPSQWNDTDGDGGEIITTMLHGHPLDQ